MPFDDRPRRIACAVKQSRVERQLVRPFVGQRLDVLVTRPLLVERDVAKIEKHQPVLGLRVKTPRTNRNAAGESAGKLEVRPFIKKNDERSSGERSFDVKSLFLVIAQEIVDEVLAVVQGDFHERLRGIADGLKLLGVQCQERPARDRPDPGLSTL